LKEQLGGEHFTQNRLFGDTAVGVVFHSLSALV